MVQIKEERAVDIAPKEYLTKLKPVMAKGILPNFAPIETPQQINDHFDDSISQTAFDMDNQQLNQAIGIQLALMLKENRLDETEDSSDDLFEKREKEFEQEKKHQEKEKIKKEKMRQEATVKVLEKNLKEPNLIVEGLKNIEKLYEDTGTIKLVNNVLKALREGNESIAKEKLKEHLIMEGAKAEVVIKMKEVVEKSSKRIKMTPKKISDKIKELAKDDKTGIQGEIKGLAKKIKRMSQAEAVGAVKDFVQKKSAPIKTLEKLEKLAKEWDKLSPKQISSRLKSISKEWRVETVRLWKNAAILSGLKKAPDQFVKKAKDLFRGEAKMLDAIKRKWAKGVIDFAKEKLLRAYQKKNKKEMGFWKGTLKELNKMRGMSIADFNKKLGILLKGRPKELATAKTRAAASVVGHIQGIADGIERSRYLKKIEAISKLANKEKMKGPFGRVLAELRDIKDKIDLLIKGSKKELDKAFAEIAKSSGVIGTFGKIMIRNANKAKKKEKDRVVKDLMRDINIRSNIISETNGMKIHSDSGKFDQVDEIGQQILKRTGQIHRANIKLSGIAKLPKNQQKKLIIKTISSLLSSPPLLGTIVGKKSSQI